MDTFDTKIDMGKLEMMFRQSPAKVKTMTMHYLNDAAFAYRTAVLDVMKTHKKIRDARFVQSKVLVQKVTSGNPNSMQAIAGSVKGDRFSGWTEDYGAQPTGRGNRILGSNARGGDMNAKAPTKNRLMSGMDMPSSKDYADIPGNWGQRIMAMISIIARNPELAAASKGMFVINSGKWHAGAYRIKPGAIAKIKKSSRKGKGKAFNWYTYAPAISKVQSFDKNTKFKKVDWAKIAMAQSLDEVRAILGKDFKEYWLNAIKPI